MLGFYFDESVSGDVVTGAVDAALDVLTAAQDGMRGGADAAILERSARLGRVLVTSEIDHVVLVAQIVAAGEVPSPVVFLRQNTMTVGQAVAELALVAAIATAEDFSGDVMRLPLKSEGDRSLG